MPHEPIIEESQITNVEFGSNVRVIKPVNIYGCKIGEDSFIGPFTEIQKGVTIGKRCRIQSHSFICELVEIGDDCFIGHGVTFVNDLFRDGGPSGRDISKWQGSTIGDRVSIGSNATIIGVRVCDRAVIGAGAVVTRHIDVAGIYAGNPAKLLRTFDAS